ncbi:hypothetical protein [uncultured Olleya sp.]|uniref:hypothetical protein n=1 Tax=uncultured Olleya sp. TaxID=757243 RepID=UPI002592A9F3|nr:hypothetical protein [uncultured Olleya sp.]
MLIKVLSLIFAFIVGVMHKVLRNRSKIYIVVLLILAIGIGSRIGFIFLILFVILSHNGKIKSLKNNLIFVFNVIFSLFFFAYLIQLRMQDEHGIIPYIAYVFDSFQEILNYFMFNLYYVIVFGVFVTARTISDDIVSWGSIYISLNPLPGSMAGWYDIFKDMRINKYCPYSSNGEVFSMGVFFTVIYYLFLGVIFGFFENKFRQFLINNKKLQAFVLLLILILHITYGFEYNLRSSVRYIYYGFFILLVFRFFGVIRKSIFVKNT